LTPSTVQIDLVPVKRLVQFSAEIEGDPVKFAVAPIDPIRASAHSKNPVADDGDTGMVVAYSENKCIGYIGILPIRARIGGVYHKVYSPTTQFVHPDFRKKPLSGGITVAESMYQTVIDTGIDQLNTGFNKAGERLHKRRPEWFSALPDYQFQHFRLTPFQPVSSLARRTALAIKAETFRVGYRVSQKIVDKALYPLVEYTLNHRSRNWENWQVIPTDHIDQPVRKENHSVTDPYFERNVDTINWMIANPWYESGGSRHPRYFFSHPHERFEYHAFNVFDPGGEKRGYFVTLISEDNLYTTLRILDYEIEMPDSEAMILSWVVGFALRERVNDIECAGSFRQAIENIRPLRRFSSIRTRQYFMFLASGSPLAGKESSITLHYCDGERAFV